MERISSKYTATTHKTEFHKNKVTNTPSFLPSVERFNDHLIYFKKRHSCFSTDAAINLVYRLSYTYFTEKTNKFR